MGAGGAFGVRPVGALAVRTAVAVVLVGAGWTGAADEAALDRQAPWIAVAVTGLIVGAASGALWLLGLRRAVTARTRALLAAIEQLEGGAEAVAPDDGLRVRRTRGGTLYHRPGCALVAGRPVTAWATGSRRGRALEPCEACGA